MKRLALLFFLISPCVSQAGGFYTGNDMNGWGEGQWADSLGKVRLQGYVSGVVDTADGVFFCLQDSVTIGQAAEIVRKYVKENPGEWHHSGAEIVKAAISSAFPCKPIHPQKNTPPPSRKNPFDRFDKTEG